MTDSVTQELAEESIMGSTPIDTHGRRITFGKHYGELFTRLPRSYLFWMVNNKTQDADIARAEIKRRGADYPAVEVSFHAIDRASTRAWKIWRATRKDDEGLYSWLARMTVEAIQAGNTHADGRYIHNGMALAIQEGECWPVLTTVVVHKQKPPQTKQPPRHALQIKRRKDNDR